LSEGHALPLRWLYARKIEQIADDLLRERDLSSQDFQILLDLGGCLFHHGAQVVNGVRHDAKRVSQLVTYSAGEQAERRQLLLPHKALLRISKLSERGLQFLGPFSNPHFQSMVGLFYLSCHVVEGIGQEAQLVLTMYVGPAAVITGGDVSRCVR
jgi:hypothetical protein